MANERKDQDQDQVKDLDNAEVAELEDKDLEDASGGAGGEDSTGNNINCGC
jgi:hypothetical protein